MQTKEAVEFNGKEFVNFEIFEGLNKVISLSKNDGKQKLFMAPSVNPMPVRIYIPKTDLGFDYMFIKPEKNINGMLYLKAKTKDDLYEIKMSYHMQGLEKGSFSVTLNNDKADVCQFVKYEEFLRALVLKKSIAIKSLEMDKVVFSCNGLNLSSDFLLPKEQYNFFKDVLLPPIALAILLKIYTFASQQRMWWNW